MCPFKLTFLCLHDEYVYWILHVYVQARSIGGMIPTEESQSTLEINLSQWYYAHQKSQMDWPGIELGALQ